MILNFPINIKHINHPFYKDLFHLLVDFRATGKTISFITTSNCLPIPQFPTVGRSIGG